MKKLITLTFLTLLLAMSFTNVVDACSPFCGVRVSLPLQEQNVPINTDIYLGFYCSSYSDYAISLVDSKTGTSVTLSEVKVSDKQAVLRPIQLLNPFSNYELKVEPVDQESYLAEYDVIYEFTTSDIEDNEDSSYEVFINEALEGDELICGGLSRGSEAGCSLSRGAANNRNISFLIFLILPLFVVIRRAVGQR